MPTMRDLPPDDRPRERLLRLGAEQLSNAELLAILLGTGRKGRSVMDLAADLLRHCEETEPGSGLRGLLQLPAADLKQALPGLGDAKLSQVLAALQLGLRAGSVPAKRVEVHNPSKVFAFVAPKLAHLDHEEFMVILLNAKNMVIAVESVSVGTLTASLVHPREVFKLAVRRSSHALILAHNHPSGDPTPSSEDYAVTERLIAAGRLLGISVLDHIIVGDGRYVSLREEGRLPWT